MATPPCCWRRLSNRIVFPAGCYRAANWIPVGATSGRGRNDRSSLSERKRHGTPVPIKQIWLYPLRRDVRKRLCAPQVCVPCSPKRGNEHEDGCRDGFPGLKRSGLDYMRCRDFVLGIFRYRGTKSNRSEMTVTI